MSVPQLPATDDAGSLTTAVLLLHAQRVQDSIVEWVKQDNWQRIVAEKRSVLACMHQVLESCHTLLDSTHIPIDSVVRLLQSVLRCVSTTVWRAACKQGTECCHSVLGLPRGWHRAVLRSNSIPCVWAGRKQEGLCSPGLRAM